MNNVHPLLRVFRTIGLVLTLGVNMSACAADTFTWKEEILLHDGKKMVVTRSQIREGRHEIGQVPPIKEHSITFTPTGSNSPIIWKSEFTKDIGHSNFDLLALDIIKGVPYIVTKPTGSLAYNKWGRPNPPYIFFKYVNQQWKQIPLQEFPVEIKQPNVVIDIYGDNEIKKEGLKSGFIPAASIQKINSGLTQKEYKTISRTPLDDWKSRPGSTDVMIPTENGWSSPDMVELRKKNAERMKAQRDTESKK